MKVSKTVSIDLDLLQRTLQQNDNFSEIVSLALENYLFFQQETERGNSIYLTKNFSTKIPKNIIWRLIRFENMVKWVNLITKAEYLTEQTMGESTKCRLTGKLGDLEASSIAEIIEYEENERLVYRAQGDFTIVSSVTVRTVGKNNEISLIVVIGLSKEIASQDRYREIYSNLKSAFTIFEKMATALS
jgi:hypothetical protein